MILNDLTPAGYDQNRRAATPAPDVWGRLVVFGGSHEVGLAFRLWLANLAA